MAAPEDMIVVRYARGDGITLTGPTKPHKDKIAKTRAGSYGFRWSPKQRLWYVPRTREAAVDRGRRGARGRLVAGVPTRVGSRAKAAVLLCSRLSASTQQAAARAGGRRRSSTARRAVQPEQVDCAPTCAHYQCSSDSPRHAATRASDIPWGRRPVHQRVAMAERRVALGKEAAMASRGAQPVAWRQRIRVALIKMATVTPGMRGCRFPRC
jgi:hypothetical protein